MPDIDSIQTYLSTHLDVFLIVIGAVIMIGVIRDWQWLCHPKPKNDKKPWMSEKAYKISLFILGALIVILEIVRLIQEA